jgi:hypothetical protein
VTTAQVNPTGVIEVLGDHARELDQLSKRLSQVETELEPVALQYEEWMGAYEEGLWDHHIAGAKLPPEALRTRMAHRAMPPELLGAHTHLVNERRRLEKRISSLKAVVDAQRSLVSALRAELEASR